MKILLPDAAGLGEAARVIAEGGVVLFPTESYYGAAVNALDSGAVARLCELKDRPSSRPMPLILPGREALSRVVEKIPEAALPLMERHWPGPLTLVLPARPELHPALVGTYGVGVRLSPHPVAASMALAYGGPITATSANHSGDPPPRDAASAGRALGGADACVDGGETPGVAPSTVLAVAVSGRLTLLRPGAVHVELG